MAKVIGSIGLDLGNDKFIEVPLTVKSEQTPMGTVLKMALAEGLSDTPEGKKLIMDVADWYLPILKARGIF